MSFNPMDPMNNGESEAGYDAVMDLVRGGSDWQRSHQSERDAFSVKAQAGAAERLAHPERFDTDGARLAKVQEQRERVANRKTEAPDLPDTITASINGPTFCEGYPHTFRALERRMMAAYWENPANPAPIPLELVREPDNEYDGNAIAIYDDTQLLGRLPREVARRLAPDMDNGAGWSCVLDKINTSTADVGRPGALVRLTRVAPIKPGTATVEDLIRESVRSMSWAEVHFELATRSLPVPDALPDMQSALAEVYVAERTTKLGGTT